MENLVYEGAVTFFWGARLFPPPTTTSSTATPLVKRSGRVPVLRPVVPPKTKHSLVNAPSGATKELPPNPDQLVWLSVLMLPSLFRRCGTAPWQPPSLGLFARAPMRHQHTADFDSVIPRSGIGSYKYEKYKLRSEPDTIPLWVADTDFQSPPHGTACC